MPGSRGVVEGDPYQDSTDGGSIHCKLTASMSPAFLKLEATRRRKMSRHNCCAARLALRQQHIFTDGTLSQPCVRRFTTTPPARAGHNKWSKTKHIKAVTDKKKNAERTYFAKQLALYSRMYGEDPKFNPQLATTVAAATKGKATKLLRHWMAM
jgi:hypothetical protein